MSLSGLSLSLSLLSLAVNETRNNNTDVNPLMLIKKMIRKSGDLQCEGFRCGSHVFHWRSALPPKR